MAAILVSKVPTRTILVVYRVNNANSSFCAPLMVEKKKEKKEEEDNVLSNLVPFSSMKLLAHLGYVRYF